MSDEMAQDVAAWPDGTGPPRGHPQRKKTRMSDEDMARTHLSEFMGFCKERGDDLPDDLRALMEFIEERGIVDPEDYA